MRPAVYTDKIVLDYKKIQGEAILAGKNILRLLFDEHIPVVAHSYANNTNCEIIDRGNKIVIKWNDDHKNNPLVYRKRNIWKKDYESYGQFYYETITKKK